MNRNKLLQIIQKNLDELSEINLEMSGSTNLSKFEVELALSKAKTILQEYEILQEINDQEDQLIAETPKVEVIHPTEKEAPTANEKEIPPAPAEVTTPKDVEKKEPEEQASSPLPTYTEEEEEEEEPIPVSIPQPELLIAEEKVEEAPKAVVPEPMVQPTEVPNTNGSAKKTLTDQFQSQSLNDLLTATNKLDHRFASSPISKLETAIGLNDRFQYIRELFSNDPDLFRDTIGKIDRMHTLEEAVEHLDSKFKWEKDDTSLQFLHLVKRRFSN